MPPPTPAEAARSMLAAGSTLVLTSPDLPETCWPGGYRHDPSGRVLLPMDEHSHVVAVLASRPAPASLSVVDVAALPMRRRVRGRADATGCAELLPPVLGRALWSAVAPGQPELEAGMRVVRFELAELTTRVDRCAPAEVRLRAYQASTPDPVAHLEAELLGHLAHEHADAVDALSARLPCSLRAGADRVVPYRLNRHQLVLRVEVGDDDVDVAFPLSGSPENAIDLLRAVRDLLQGARPALTRPDQAV